MLPIMLFSDSIASAWTWAKTGAVHGKGTATALRIFPIRLDDAVTDTGAAGAAHIRRTRHIGDFRQWPEESSYRKALARLVRDLQVVE